jgi:hypothetical protein
MIRIISFNTGYDLEKSTDKRKALKDKRITYITKPENYKFNIDDLAKDIREVGNLFYDNFNEAKIILGGDGVS